MNIQPRKYSFMFPLYIFFGLAGLLAATSCTGVNLGNPYRTTANTHPAQDYASPYTTIARGGLFYHSAVVPGQLGLTDRQAQKTGQACSYSALWLVSWGDSSIEAARQSAKIKQIESMQHRVRAILGWIYHSHCTILTGT